jgi:predicted nucleic acid-binding protein
VPAYFFDSSAIVKRYVNEKGTAWVVESTNPASGARVYIASVTGVEVIAALARKRKGNELTPLFAAAAISEFHNYFQTEYKIVSITSSVIARSIDRANAHALRGYDAIQLGAALEVNGRRVALGVVTPLTLVTADNELLLAAAAEGLLTDNPVIH